VTGHLCCDMCDRYLRDDEGVQDWEGAIFCDGCAADHGVEAVSLTGTYTQQSGEGKG
jgi:hypothetical protein